MDVNDRALRSVDLGTRSDSFSITSASEVMALFCLSKNEEDFLNRVEDITVAYSLDNKPIFVK